MKFSLTAGILLLLVNYTIGQDDQCYGLDGKPTNYIPCTGSAFSSSDVVPCCGEADVCLSSGLCLYQGARDSRGVFRADGCTDPTLKHPLCQPWCKSK